jgi:hypothetical protein
LSAFPFKQRNDRDAEMKVWQMSKNHGISRTGTIWCLPDDTEPVALDLSVADFYGLFVRQSTKTADIRLRKGRLMAEINQCFHCADESATERFYRLLQEDGLFRYASMDHDILIIRPYKIGMDGEVIIPAMCQKVPKAEVDEPSAQELDLALEPEVSVCEEVDMDEGEDLRLALPDDIMDYEITELRALLDRLEEALEQEARQIVTFSPLSTIEQIVVGNEEGLDDILDRAQLLWKISKAAGVVSSALVELRSARDHLMRQIATYNEFDQGEE